MPVIVRTEVSRGADDAGNGRRLVVFGSFDTLLHPRVAVLRDGLAAHGWTVQVLNAPLGASTADKVASAGSPTHALRLVRRQMRSWRALIAQRRSVGQADVVLVGYMGHVDVHLARGLFRRSLVALDHLVGLADTVRDRELGGQLTGRTLDLIDRAALGVADVVVVDTRLQRAGLPVWAEAKAVVAPVGAQEEWFSAARGPAARSRPPGDELRVVFFGLYTPLQGAPVIGAAIALLADAPVRFTMIGDGQERRATQLAAGDSTSVTWLDWVEGTALPELVAAHDVCLGIFGTTTKATRVVPTKVYQGLAAGCAVVTGDTPACEDLRDAVTTVPVGDPAALADLLRRLAADEEALAMARRRTQAGAKRITPAAVTSTLDAALATAVADRAAPPPPPLTLNAWFRWDVVVRELAAAGPRKVLEIGPGEGAVACRLARGREYTGVEPSERTRALTAQRLTAQGTPGRLVGSLDELDPESRFDLVCAFEVIEHIEDDAAALSDWVARARPGGLVILSTPASPERFGAHDVLAGHYRRYRPDALAQLARDAGLVDVRVVHTGFPLGYPLERARHALAARRLAGSGIDPSQPQADPALFAAHTERSSSLLQPPRWSGRLTEWASFPARWTQRRRPDRGTGLVLVARAARPGGGPARAS